MFPLKTIPRAEFGSPCVETVQYFEFYFQPPIARLWTCARVATLVCFAPCLLVPPES